MDPINGIILLILLLLSAFFSGSETAFFSLTKIQLKKIENDKSKSSKLIKKLLKKPQKLLVTILLANTVVNVSASALATMIAIQMATQIDPSYRNIFITGEIVIMTLLLLIFGEITPKLIGFYFDEKLSKFSVRIHNFLMIILWPLIFILTFINKIFSESKNLSKENKFHVTSQDFIDFIQSSDANHSLSNEEVKIIDGVFNLSSQKAKEVMTPRVDIEGIDISDPNIDLTKVFIDSGFSRIPVYEDNIDNILGLIYIKDYILTGKNKKIKDLIRKPYFIPESMQIDKLLNIMKRKKVHIAIVVDEYGGTSGIISMEDVLEELVGEIHDEFDEENMPVKKITDTEYLISGLCTIHELNREFDLRLDESEYDILADYLLAEFKDIPKEKNSLKIEDTKFIIEDVKKRRINSVKLIIENEKN